MSVPPKTIDTTPPGTRATIHISGARILLATLTRPFVAAWEAAGAVVSCLSYALATGDDHASAE